MPWKKSYGRKKFYFNSASTCFIVCCTNWFCLLDLLDSGILKLGFIKKKKKTTLPKEKPTLTVLFHNINNIL